MCDILPFYGFMWTLTSQISFLPLPFCNDFCQQLRNHTDIYLEKLFEENVYSFLQCFSDHECNMNKEYLKTHN